MYIALVKLVFSRVFYYRGNLKKSNYSNLSIGRINVKMSILGPRPPGPMKLISAGFDFLAVCVKCSCATLIKHICEFSAHKH